MAEMEADETAHRESQSVRDEPAGAGATRRRALLLVNARSRRAADVLDDLVARLRDIRDLDVVIGACDDAEALSDTIVAHRDRVDMVVVGGGDGTVNAAARGLVETGLPLALIPLGTANDLARTLAIPEDLDGALAIVRAGRTRAIDIGQVNDRHFFNVASIGLSVALARALTPDLKKRFGRLGYLVALLKILVRARPFRARIEAPDWRVRVRTLQIAVGNGLYYGGGMEVAAGATIDNGTLDLYSLEVGSVWKLLLMAPAFRAGRHGTWKEVRTVEATGFTVSTRRPRPVNADGEIITYTPATFRILPKAVRVFAPPGAPGLTLQEPDETAP